MTIHRLQMYSVIVLVLLLASTLTTHASNQSTVDIGRPALDGYSPVSYYEQGHPEAGSRKYQSTYQGNIYWLTSARQKRRFDANPSAYAPIFPHSCPYNLAQGRRETVDPTNFKIVDGQLLLFHRSPAQDGRKEWEKSIEKTGVTEKELLRRARSNFINLEF